MRIIIVEDEVKARQGLVTVISNLHGGHTVLAQAGDGRKGFELIQRLKPDLVFTDVKMDFANGIEMIKLLRNAQNDVKIVIISAYEEFDYAKAALEYDVLDYITKPIVPQEIEHCIAKAERLTERELARGTDAKEPALEQALLGKEGFLHPCVKKALDVIEKEFSLQLVQDEMARRFRITPQYFSYLFKRDTGNSFTNYLRKYRIQIAKEMLCNNHVKVNEVAACIGYPDSKYFCRIFKAETGMSPTQYVFYHTTH